MVFGMFNRNRSRSRSPDRERDKNYRESRNRSDSLERKSIPRGRETYEHNINPTLIYSLDRLRDGLNLVYGRNAFIVFGDIMQLTVRVHLPMPENLVARLQDEGFLCREPVELLPPAVKDQIKANGWYQMRPYDQGEPYDGDSLLVGKYFQKELLEIFDGQSKWTLDPGVVYW